VNERRGLRYSSKVKPLSAIEVRDASVQGPRNCDSQYLDVWLLSSKIDADQREIYEGVLSNEERVRAGRFVFEEDRSRCITARGGLRWLLSSYSGMKPDELQFQTGDHGKPSLHNSAVPVHFNASHSGD
jgi:4'-phosphopantetheinyl transferase